MPVQLIAEDVLVLLLDAGTGRPRTEATRLDFALAGALLVELSLDGRIDVRDGGRRAPVVVLDGRRTEDALLDEALQLMGQRSRRADQLVPALSKGLRSRLIDRLEDRGRVRRERRRLLGLFPVQRVYPVETRRDRELVQRLRDVLLAGVAPDPRTSVVVALLASIDAAWRVTGASDRRTRTAVRRRAKDIAQGQWAAEGVRRAVQAVEAAVAASTTAAVTATTIATS